MRIPFLKQVFPDARFIFLWRDPRENVSSIMEAWRAGGWVTYPALPGWDGPWSLLLPPGWQMLRGAPLETVAAWQWRSVNQTALDDLQSLPPEDWTQVNYQDFLADPEAAVRRLCDFARVLFDAALQARTRGRLPLVAPDQHRARAGQMASRRGRHPCAYARSGGQLAEAARIGLTPARSTPIGITWRRLQLGSDCAPELIMRGASRHLSAGALPTARRPLYRIAL